MRESEWAWCLVLWELISDQHCVYVYILQFATLQENQRLREQNEELNGQILSLSLHEAKNLIATQTKAQSLAAEIDNASRDQVCCSPRSSLDYLVAPLKCVGFLWKEPEIQSCLVSFILYWSFDPHVNE